MGIPSYFRIIIEKYKHISITHLPHIHLFCLDYNGIIHPIAHSTILIDQNEDNMFNVLWDYTLSLISKYKTSFIAIDGVAPLAKISQQRKRRYLKPKSDIWDTNHITSGTPFMNRLNLFIKNKSILNTTDDCSILFDGSDNCGEGEHKIFEYIKDFSLDKNILIHGLDADLIILSLISFKNVYLMRDNNGIITYISISELRKAILLEWKYLFLEYHNDKDKIYAYCIACSLLGNDFLPHLLTINLHNGGIDKIKNTFNFIKNSPLVINSKIQINVLSLILKKLSENEDNDMIKELHTYKITNFPIDIKWRKYYYENISFIPDINMACKLYLDGISWTFNYYLKNTTLENIDHGWYYPFNDAPSLKDLANISLNYNYLPLNTLNNFIENDIQLLIVIPKQSIDILPNSLHKYYIDENYGLTYMYPTSFPLIKFFKKFDWMYIPILPIIDINFIKSATLI
jgi:5'-3' exonuclease